MLVRLRKLDPRLRGDDEGLRDVGRFPFAPFFTGRRCPIGRMRGCFKCGDAPHPSAALPPSPREKQGEGRKNYCPSALTLVNHAPAFALRFAAIAKRAGLAAAGGADGLVDLRADGGLFDDDIAFALTA